MSSKDDCTTDMEVVQLTYPEDVRSRVLDQVAAGSSLRSAARDAGVCAAAAGSWVRESGLGAMHRGRRGGLVKVRIAEVEPGERKSPRSRLTRDDREKIARLGGLGCGVPEIARRTGFHRTTIARELGRHADAGGLYDPGRAQAEAEESAKRPKAPKLAPGTRLRAYVADGLRRGWSPEQISGRLRVDFPDDEGMRVSHETIYQAIYVRGAGSLRAELECAQALRSGREGRRRRSGLPGKRGSRPWVEGANIADRPDEALGRQVPGHWEGDLVIGGDMSSCLITLVDRCSRATQLSRLDVHTADVVEGRLEEMAADIPAMLRRTITWDQGTEMAEVATFELATDFKVYFCNPRSPWERPTNENTNGLVRQYFPKGTDFAKVTDEEVRRVQDLLNSRPRKALGFKTPSEVLNEILLRDGAMTI